jgi:hypothetical protein
MVQAFSLSLKYLPLRTGSLDGAREFYEKLLGLSVCGEHPGDFVQLSVGDAALCVDRAGAGDPPAAIFAVTGPWPVVRTPRRRRGDRRWPASGPRGPVRRRA